MSYEFVPVTEIPTVPEHWSLQALRIYEVIPFRPILIPRGSLIADANSTLRPQIYIDTNDPFVPESKVSFPDDAPMTAVMHVQYKDRDIDGYIADLRYYGELTKRSITGYLSHEEIEMNENLKPEALLGSACLDICGVKLEIHSEYAELPELQHHFGVLLGYIDKLRAKKSVTVSTAGQLDSVERDSRPQFRTPSEPSD